MGCSACIKFNADRCQGCVLATLRETPDLFIRLKLLEPLYGLDQLKAKVESKARIGIDIEDWIRRKSYPYEKISLLESEVRRLQNVVEGISGAAPLPKKPVKVSAGPSAGTRSAVRRVGKGTAGPLAKKSDQASVEVSGPSGGTRSAVRRVGKGTAGPLAKKSDQAGVEVSGPSGGTRSAVQRVDEISGGSARKGITTFSASVPVPKKKPYYKSLSSIYEQEAVKGTAGSSARVAAFSGSRLALPRAPPVPRKARSAVRGVALAAEVLIGLQDVVPEEQPQPQQVEVQD